MDVPAVIRGLSLYYADGVESQEIWVDKRAAEGLPGREGERFPVRLTIGSQTFTAGIRSTARTPYAWICPDLYDEAGDKVRLVDALRRAGFEKNERVYLRVLGTGLAVTKAD